MEKKKVAIVTLGDSRREFYKKREAIVASEIEKVKKAFGDKYDLYISPIVFDTEDGQNISDEIKKQGIEAVIIHVPIWATPSLAFRIAYGTSYPVLLLGNLQRNTSSLVTLLAVGGMLDQTGKKCIRVSGDYEDPQIQEKVDNFVKRCLCGRRHSPFQLWNDRRKKYWYWDYGSRSKPVAEYLWGRV